MAQCSRNSNERVREGALWRHIYGRHIDLCKWLPIERLETGQSVSHLCCLFHFSTRFVSHAHMMMIEYNRAESNIGRTWAISNNIIHRLGHLFMRYQLDMSIRLV
jgi:hypothetical protein